MTCFGFSIGDKVRSRKFPNWGLMVVTSFYSSGNIECITTEGVIGSFKPEDLYSEDAMTDEELAKKFRESYKKYSDHFSELSKRGYSIKFGAGTLKITKTETKEI